MNTSQPRHIDREGAEQLLDRAAAGSARADDPLALLLTAAAAPADDRELAGEDLAVAAFTAHLAGAPASSPAPGHARPAASRLTRNLSLKIAGVAAALAGVGVALAAATGVFSSTAPSHAGAPSAGAPTIGTSQGGQASPAHNRCCAPGPDRQPEGVQAGHRGRNPGGAGDPAVRSVHRGGRARSQAG